MYALKPVNEDNREIRKSEKFQETLEQTISRTAFKHIKVLKGDFNSQSSKGRKH